MTCNNKEMENKISMYLDKDLPESEVKALEEHIQSCDTCKALYEDLKLMNEIMSDMPVMDLPEDFESELHDKLVKVSTKSTADEMASDNGINLDVDTNNNKQDNDSFERKVIRIPLPSFKDFKRHSKPLTALAATVMIAVLAYGAGNVVDNIPKSMDTATYESAMEETESAQMFTEEAAPMEAAGKATFDESVSADVAEDGANYGLKMNSQANDDIGTSSINEAPQPRTAMTKAKNDSRMIIYTADTWIDIVDYDSTYEKIVKMVNDMGGYVGEANTSYKHYNESEPEKSLKRGRLTIRVPQGQFMGTVDFLESIGIQKNLNIWSQDITSQYRDIANEVANLEIREAKLREIMESAKEIEDVITVERELSRVRGEINNYTGTLKEWDRLVSLSTIHIELNEVETLEPKIKPIDKSLLQKAKDGLVNSINQLKYLGETVFIGLVAFSPKLLVWIIIFFFGYKIVKWLVKRIRK
ncbi:DUF4349 domain-containing protein [Fusibacter sp. JL216-2]|uniref:DUF4349 domain-containing protein n=1 Tax=Fusibacter sp. JL216-2 TaxID=3071453 RepID=UPI003D34B0F9